MRKDYFKHNQILSSAIMLIAFFGFAPVMNAQTTPKAQVSLGYNEVNPSQFLVWDSTLTAVGWYLTPAAPFSLTGVQTNFNAVQQTGSQDRNVTVEVLTDRRAVGGTLLRSVVFNSASARGRLGGVTFAPVTLNAGTRYFIGFRGISGIGINTTTDAGAVNCGACLYLDNPSSAEGQYATRGGSNQPSAQDQPIIRLVGTIVGNGNAASRNFDGDGDGISDLTVFRPSTGEWYRLNSSSGQFSGVAFGASTDLPTGGDFDGDGLSDISVFRPANGYWYRLNSSNGTFVAVPFGAAADRPVATDFDGDGKTDIAVFRPSNGTWYFLRSSDGSFGGIAFGQNGDIPLQASPTN